MHFVLQTASLQHLAGVKIVAHLWNQPDIFTQIEESINNLRPFKWKEIEVKVKSKVSALSLPETCKEEALKFIEPLGKEIFKWCRYHNVNGRPNSFQFLSNLLPRQFWWSMHGTIDYVKTAEVMMKDERLSVEKRFEFACLNCLEDEARQLIELIPSHRIHKYISEAIGYRIMDPRFLIVYFACTLCGDEDLLNRILQAMEIRGGSVNNYLFQIVSYNGPRATCEYFSQKVSQLVEKQQVYFRLFFHNTQSPTCALMYRLSLINDEEQEPMFQGFIAFLLPLFLIWPLQPLFVEAAKRVWQFMDTDNCTEVLNRVICKIINGFRDYDYAQLFRELWRLSPTEQKHHFLSYLPRLVNLISTKRKEFIQLVFNKAPAHLLNELVERPNYFYDEISRMLMDESVISDASLMECKEKAALKSSKDQDNEDKRLRSQHLSRLVDMVMERRIYSREKYTKFDN